MTKYIILFFSFAFFISCNTKKKDNEKGNKISYEVYETGGGWGYKILINNKATIDQDRIPAIKGRKPFISKEDAEKTAKLVIEKFKNKKTPSVSREELEEMGIQIPE